MGFADLRICAGGVFHNSRNSCGRRADLGELLLVDVSSVLESAQIAPSQLRKNDERGAMMFWGEEECSDGDGDGRWEFQGVCGNKHLWRDGCHDTVFLACVTCAGLRVRFQRQ